MSRLFGIASAVVLLLPLQAMGYGYPDAVGQGSPMPGIDAVSHGFGGASAVDVGGMSLFGNPSATGGDDVQLSIGALILKQTVDDGLGKHTLSYAGLGSSAVQASFDAGAVDLALGIAKIRDYTYTGEYFFLEENPDSVIAGFEDYTVKGGIWETAMGISRDITPCFSLGASAGYRMGNIDYEYYWHHFNESIEDSTVTWTREEGEFAWRAGATYKLPSGASIGGCVSSASENCPASYALGAVFGDLAGGFPGVGVEAKIWDTQDNPSWRGTVFGGIHPEHNLFFRGAVNLTSKGQDDSNVSLGISLGVGIRFSAMELNAAFNYNNDSRNSNVFGFPLAETINDIVSGFTCGVAIPL